MTQTRDELVGQVDSTPRAFVARTRSDQPPCPTRPAFIARSIDANGHVTDHMARDRAALGLAATVEVMGPAPSRRRRRIKRSAPGKPWQPWKSFGLLGGAAVAVATLASIAIVTPLAKRESLAVPVIAQPNAAPMTTMAIRTIAHEAVGEPHERPSPKAATAITRRLR